MRKSDACRRKRRRRRRRGRRKSRSRRRKRSEFMNGRDVMIEWTNSLFNRYSIN